jgi:hypothetical protein
LLSPSLFGNEKYNEAFRNAQDMHQIHARSASKNPMVKKGKAIVYARELLLPLVEPSLHLQPLRFELQHTVNSRHWW